jgi:DNA-binding transcriptional regulator YhcF (GntR family)
LTTRQPNGEIPSVRGLASDHGLNVATLTEQLEMTPPLFVRTQDAHEEVADKPLATIWRVDGVI